MIEAHVHCAECLSPIATTIKGKNGKTKPAEIHTGRQLQAVPAPGGVGFAERNVPLCPECVERIAAAEKRSRLVVPEAPGAALRRPAVQPAAGIPSAPVIELGRK